MNLDKLATGASTHHIIEKIRNSNRYSFIKGNLINEKLVREILKDNEVGLTF